MAYASYNRVRFKHVFADFAVRHPRAISPREPGYFLACSGKHSNCADRRYSEMEPV